MMLATAVYFIQAKSGGPIKIGCARSLKCRLRQLQVGNPAKLQILASVPGTIADERAIQKRFSDSRAHLEWFHPTPELLQLIEIFRIRAGSEPIERAA
jgi:hypothetical protein